jgi:hypothetical protein
MVHMQQLANWMFNELHVLDVSWSVTKCFKQDLEFKTQKQMHKMDSA